ncbi:MAG: threonine--tRNA ligase, partial [Candidatus Omnitrophica bacterium]|nr:threonine--tRNA ligase [Candidatus Omnitrophota bacterium]
LAMADFGFLDLAVELSTRPEKSIGTDEDWQRATSALEQSLKEKNLNYEVNPQEGAFYGPKIDIKIKDALKRKWQCATIQCDFVLAQRFGLKFINSQGSEEPPVLIHRVILGSLERFMGVLLEHYAGALPLWLAPIQVNIIPIKTTAGEWAAQVALVLKEQSIRVGLDSRNLTLDKKIRESEMGKIPYSVILGEREAKAQTVAVRKRGEGKSMTMPLEDFVDRIKEESRNKVA